jgi:hypothetical protein
MTRKDYEAIAESIRWAYESIEPDYQPNTRDNMRNGISRASIALAEKLKQDNPRFDRARFINACKETAQ